MTWDLQSVRQYISGMEEFTIPQLQAKFNMSYREALDSVAKLVEMNIISYGSGLYYKVLNREGAIFQNGLAREKFTYVDENGCKKFDLKGCLRQMKSDEEDAEPSDEDDIDKPELDWDYYNAVEMAAEDGRIDGRLLSIRLQLSIRKALRILTWMENMGFVERGDTLSVRESLITKDDIDFSGDRASGDIADRIRAANSGPLRSQILSGAESDEPDFQYYKVLKICSDEGSVSAFTIRRKIDASFAKILKIISWMEDAGYCEKGRGFINRKMLIDKQEVERILQGVGVIIEEEEYYDDDEEESIFDDDDDDDDDGGLFDDDDDDIDAYFEKVNKQLSELGIFDDEPLDIANLNPIKDSYGVNDYDAEVFLLELKCCFGWERSDCGDLFIKADGLKFKTGEEVKFKLVKLDSREWIITDNTFAKYSLTKVKNLSDGEADERIEQFVKDTNVVFTCNELRLKVDDDAAAAAFVNLFHAVQSII